MTCNQTLIDCLPGWPEEKEQYVLVKELGTDISSIEGCSIFHIEKGAWIYHEQGPQIMELMRMSGVPILLPDEVPKRFYHRIEVLSFMADADCSEESEQFVKDNIELENVADSHRLNHIAEVLRNGGCNEIQVSSVLNAYEKAYDDFRKEMKA